MITRNFRYIAVTNDTPTSAQDCLLGNAKDLFISSNIGFRLANIPGVLNFRAIYTHFRFEKITCRFIPMTVQMVVEDHDTGTSASSISKATPRFYLSRLWGNELASDFQYESEQSCLVDCAKGVNMNRGMTFSWVPNTLQPAQTSRAPTSASTTQPPTTGWLPIRKKWHSMSDLATIFYGLKYAITSTSNDQQEFMYRVLVTAKISFKGSADSNYTQSAPGGTVLIPFTALTT